MDLAASDAAVIGKGINCPLSPVEYGAPDGMPNDTGLVFWWYVNADRTIWAAAANMEAGDNKVPWIRPKGSELQVSARRLDASSAPGVATVACCYGGLFQASALSFPSEGCWEISATAGSSKLTFVTLVRRALSGAGDVASLHPSPGEISPATVTAKRLPDFGDPMESARRDMEERLLARRPAEIRQLERSRALWLENGIKSYRYTVSSSSDAWGIRTVPMVVTVRNEIVISAEYAHPPLRADANEGWLSRPSEIVMDVQPYDTIPKLFEIVERVLTEPLTVVTVQYDAQYGYPTSISTDQWDVSDDSGSVYVGGFQVLE